MELVGVVETRVQSIKVKNSNKAVCIFDQCKRRSLEGVKRILLKYDDEKGEFEYPIVLMMC